MYLIAPIWLVKIGLGFAGKARKYVPEEQRIYFDSIDFKELRNGMDVLKRYKGLNLIDIKSKDGTEVRITV